MRGKHKGFQRLLWELVRRHNMFEIVHLLNQDGFPCTYGQISFWSRGGGYAPPDLIPYLYRALSRIDVEDAMGLMHFVTRGTGLSVVPAPEATDDTRLLEWDLISVGVAYGKLEGFLLDALSRRELSSEEIARAKKLVGKVLHEIRVLEKKLDLIQEQQQQRATALPQPPALTDAPRPAAKASTRRGRPRRS
jgi:hypothetical protein